jgi:endonuclease/exonuclease/phosphatase family metal-dependent hydrolase
VDSGGRPLTLVGVHLSVPFPLSSLPCPYCPSLRDQQVVALAAFAAERQGAGEPIVVAGDLNLTEREVAYRDLAGLTDVVRGGTWRPLPINWLPPVLRLDYVLSSPDISVASSDVDCAASSSDHCVVVARLAVP